MDVDQTVILFALAGSLGIGAMVRSVMVVEAGGMQSEEKPWVPVFADLVVDSLVKATAEAALAGSAVVEGSM